MREKRSLESLYLEPLAKRVKANGGSVHKTKAPFHLMIDFKTDGPKTYAALQPLREKYRFMLTEFGRKNKTKAVTIVISGSRRARRWKNKPSAWPATTGGCPILAKGRARISCRGSVTVGGRIQVARQG